MTEKTKCYLLDMCRSYLFVGSVKEAQYGFKRLFELISEVETDELYSSADLKEEMRTAIQQGFEEGRKTRMNWTSAPQTNMLDSSRDGVETYLHIDGINMTTEMGGN